MRSIQNISFPRSGHHLLVRCLTQIFGERLGYCEYYTHCRTTPCPEPANNLQKNHDFHLRLQWSPQYSYLVQYRHPIEAIDSWFTYRLNHPNRWERWTIRDTKWHWHRFFSRKLKYWRRFIEKWVVDQDRDNVLTMDYRDFVRYPRRQLERIVKFVDRENEPDQSRLDWVLKIQEIKARRPIVTHQYYDARWVVDVERQLQPMLERAGIRSLMTVADQDSER